MFLIFQALSKALMELRAEMVHQAQDDVRANMDQVAVQKNVQKVVEKHTKELHVSDMFNFVFVMHSVFSLSMYSLLGLIYELFLMVTVSYLV